MLSGTEPFAADTDETAFDGRPQRMRRLSRSLSAYSDDDALLRRTSVTMQGFAEEDNCESAVSFPDGVWHDRSLHAKDLVRSCLTIDPEKRIDAAGVLKHPWFGQKSRKESSPRRR